VKHVRQGWLVGVCEQVRVVVTAAASLDRENHTEHHLTVSAFDAGQPARTGQLDITVVVLDANDNSPVFDYSAYEVQRQPTKYGLLLLLLLL